MKNRKLIKLTIMAGLATITGIAVTSDAQADVDGVSNTQQFTIQQPAVSPNNIQFYSDNLAQFNSAQTIRFPQGYTLEALNNIQAPQDSLNFATTSKQVFNNDSNGQNVNDYQSDSMASQEQVDINHLTTQQVAQLNTYGLSLVNKARAEFNEEPFTQNQGTINNVKEMAQQYQDKNESLMNGYSHDFKIIGNYSENIAANQIYTDNIAGLAARPFATARMEDFKDSKQIPLFTLNTMDDLRALIYYGIIGMLFDDAGENGQEQFGHAKNFLLYYQPINSMALYPAVQDDVNYNGIRSDGSTFSYKVKNIDMHYIWADSTSKAGWHTVGEKTYYYNNKGDIATGELNIDGDWYYFQPETGEMTTGFQKLPDGRIVYYNEKGQLQNGLTKAADGYTYYFDMSNGNMYRGEKQLNGHWYYFLPENGRMKIGFQKLPDGRIVYYNEDGQLQNGLTRAADGYTYYFDMSNGNMYRGEKQLNGHWYYFLPENGRMKIGFQKLPDGRIVYYNEDGQLQNGLTRAADGYTYYFDMSNGNMYRGEKQLNGHWYYFLPENGRMKIGFQKLPDGRIVYYNEKGQLQNGLTKAVDGYTYYFDMSNGNMYRGEKQLNGHWYYFLPKNGRMKV